jgi:phosphatidylserine/phosphatidylglycerophosphate/cardiolipin synthase-like enzyme
MTQDVRSFLFLDSDEFIKDLQFELCNNIKRVVFIYFRLVHQDYFKKIYPLLLFALEHGAQVEFYLDGVFSKSNLVSGLLLPPIFLPHRREQEKASKILQKVLNNLSKRGAQIHYFNIPKNFFTKFFMQFSGRDHRKFVYIEKNNGSSMTYFGSCNLDRSGTHDFMIKIVDSELSNRLLVENLNVWHNPCSKNRVIEVSDDKQILIDSGAKFQSVIWKTGISNIRNAKNRIIFVSQLPPEPPLLYEFFLARLRGVKVRVLLPAFKHKNVSSFPYIIAFLLAKLVCQILSIQLIHVKPGYTHAKILICDNRVLLGSHNMSFIGVAAGTIEMSLDTTDYHLLNAALQFTHRLLYFANNFK